MTVIKRILLRKTFFSPLVLLQSSTMSLLVTLLLLSLVSQCWTAPQVSRYFSFVMFNPDQPELEQNFLFPFQRRNWTSQAILYLKGARKNALTAANSHPDFRRLSDQNNIVCWSFTEGRRSFLERARREEESTFHSGVWIHDAARVV